MGISRTYLHFTHDRKAYCGVIENIQALGSNKTCLRCHIWLHVFSPPDVHSVHILRICSTMSGAYEQVAEHLEKPELNVSLKSPHQASGQSAPDPHTHVLKRSAVQSNRTPRLVTADSLFACKNSR